MVAIGAVLELRGQGPHERLHRYIALEIDSGRKSTWCIFNAPPTSGRPWPWRRGAPGQAGGSPHRLT